MTYHPESQVLLSAGCRIDIDANCVTIGTREEDITITSNRPEAIGFFLERLKFGGAAYQLADNFDIPQSAVTHILDSLHDSELLLDLDGSVNAQTPDAIAHAFQHEAQFWSTAIFNQPFWDNLLSGNFSRAQVLGWGVEFYHFVDAANTYMPIGIAHTRGARDIRPAIARHYVEEMNHGEIFLDGLARSDIDVKSVLVAPPLPHTAALINNLTEFAYEGALAYTACFAVMQPGLSTGAAQQLDRFYGALSDYYPYAREMFAAFHRHASLDLTLEHHAPPFFTLCREEPILSVEARRRASEVMRSVAESFILFFEGIQDTYENSDAFAPRRPFSMEAIL